MLYFRIVERSLLLLLPAQLMVTIINLLPCYYCPADGDDYLFITQLMITIIYSLPINLWWLLVIYYPTDSYN